MAGGRWFVIGPVADGVVLCTMQGPDLSSQTRFADMATAQRAADALPGPLVSIAAGVPVTVPAPILPTEIAGALPDLVQDQPRGVLDGWVRLWVAGALRGDPDWDGVICAVQGDVTHWIQVSASEIVSFQGFLTGRLIASLNGSAEADADALSDSLSRPERLAAHLRSAEIAGNGAAVTGHLTGAELAAARPFWLGQEVLIIADGARMQTALAAQGVSAVTRDPQAMLDAGLAVLAESIARSP